MTDETPVLVVDPDTIARLAGLTRPMDEDTEWQVSQAILDAQADVAAYLGREITPTLTNEAGLWPAWGGALTDASTWILLNQPVIAILSTVASTGDPFPIGTYTVYYTYGLDAANDPKLEPIRRWIRASVLASPTLSSLIETTDPGGSRVINSLSAEGQSVSYGAVRVPGASVAGAAGSGAPGSVPLLKSLDRWRLAGRRVFQRRDPFYYPAYVPASVVSAGAPILVLGVDDPVPSGTPAGTIIIRH